jgi:dextranase
MKQWNWRDKTMIICTSTLLLSTLLAGCTSKPKHIDPSTVANAELLRYVTTDKSRYNPGEAVQFELQLNEAAATGDILVRYMHLDEVVAEETIKWDGKTTAMKWNWTPPKDDFQGYMSEIFVQQGKELVDQLNIAVDVSSDWGKFPRYGYLADFMAADMRDQEQIIEKLNRYRINGIQFYDWQWKHHIPLKLEGEQPASQWPEIANRLVSYDTVKNYIDLAHEKNMMAMNYNLLFGAFDDAEQDGVQSEWGLFKDPLLNTQDKHPLPDSWASDIMLYNPAHTGWQQYLLNEEKKVFQHLPFDGWHVDQLGDRGVLYDGEAQKVNLAETYVPFLQKAKQELGVDLVMNAVGQYAQANIAQTPVQFLYTEVWDGHPQYRNLKDIVDQNLKFSDGRLNTVLAAYMNYNHANGAGEFNTPGVLLANAVIFAAGGAHLELGENMLAKEYFPNKNLSMSEELQQALILYYDYLTAYQNVLRDGAVDQELDVSAVEGAELSSLPRPGKVWTFAKAAQDRTMLHLINFTNANSMNWNDTNATQAEQEEKNNIKIRIKTDGKVNKVWMASPDYYEASAIPLPFEQNKDELSVTIPKLKYYTMLVLEH